VLVARSLKTAASDEEILGEDIETAINSIKCEPETQSAHVPLNESDNFWGKYNRLKSDLDETKTIKTTQVNRALSNAQKILQGWIKDRSFPEDLHEFTKALIDDMRCYRRLSRFTLNEISRKNNKFKSHPEKFFEYLRGLHREVGTLSVPMSKENTTPFSPLLAVELE